MNKRITITFDTKLKKTDKEIEKAKKILNKLKDSGMDTGVVKIKGFTVSIEDITSSMGF